MPRYIFKGWFSINIPESWEHSIDKDLLSISSIENASGTIQISFFHRKDLNKSLKGIAEEHLNQFLRQYNIDIKKNTYKITETQNYTIANASGLYDSNFIEIWTIVNEKKMLLVTYISPQKTKELLIAREIINSIVFEN